MVKAYDILGHLAAVESRFAPSCLDEYVCGECLFDCVDFSQFHKHNLHVHGRLPSDKNTKSALINPLKFSGVDSYI